MRFDADQGTLIGLELGLQNFGFLVTSGSLSHLEVCHPCRSGCLHHISNWSCCKAVTTSELIVIR